MPPCRPPSDHTVGCRTFSYERYRRFFKTELPDTTQSPGTGGLMVGLRSILFATRSRLVRLSQPRKTWKWLAFSHSCFVDMEGVTGSIPVAPTILFNDLAKRCSPIGSGRGNSVGIVFHQLQDPANPRIKSVSCFIQVLWPVRAITARSAVTRAAVAELIGNLFPRYARIFGCPQYRCHAMTETVDG